MPGDDDHLELNAIRRIDEACDRFERGLQSGRPEIIATTADGWVAPERASLVRELIRVDRYYANRHCQQRDRTDYVTLLSDDQGAVDGTLSVEWKRQPVCRPRHVFSNDEPARPG